MRRKGSSKSSSRNQNLNATKLVTKECGCGRFGLVAADADGFVCPACVMKSAMRIGSKKEESTEPKKRTRVMTPEGLKSFREKRAATAAKRKAARHQLASKMAA